MNGQTMTEKMIAHFRSLLFGGRFEGHDIWCFGHTQATLELIGLFEAAGIRICGILDNNPEKQGQIARGIPIVSPSVFLAGETRGTLVCIVSRAYAAMVQQLEEGGYQGRVEKLVDYNTFAAYSLDGSVRREKSARVARGIALWKTLREAYPTDVYFVFPFAAIGDVCHAMAYLDAYCEKTHVYRRQIIVAEDEARQAAALYGEDAIAYPQEQMDELVQAAIAEQASDVQVIHHDRPYTNYMIRLLRKVFMPFDDFYRCGIYGLPENTIPRYPSRFVEPKDCHGMIEGRSVILAPWAKSVAGLPASFWEAEAARWSSEGWRVFTNLAPGEESIPGTRPLAVPLCELLPLAERAGVFVALRSGVCEVLAGARCRKIVYFPDAHYSDTPWPVSSFFYVPGWENVIIGEDGSRRAARVMQPCANSENSAK